MHILTAARELCTSRNGTESHFQGRDRCPEGEDFPPGRGYCCNPLEDSQALDPDSDPALKFLIFSVGKRVAFRWHRSGKQQVTSHLSYPDSDRSQHHQTSRDGGRAVGIIPSKHSIATGNPWGNCSSMQWFRAGEKGAFPRVILCRMRHTKSSGKAEAKPLSKGQVVSSEIHGKTHWCSRN